MDVDVNALCEKSASKALSLERVDLEPGAVQFIDVSVNSNQQLMPVINLSDKREVIEVNEKIGESILSIDEMQPVECRRDEIILDEINTASEISETHKEELRKLLNKYRHCIAKNLLELGKTDKIVMDIEVEKDAVVQAKPYRLNANDRQELDDIIAEYRRAGIVTDTDSAYASPAFIIRREKGNSRMIIDYRRLNKVTKIVPYPIPNFDDMLEKLNGAQYFITLDLASGYLQMPLSDEAKEKTAFITESQTGQFERAMFGLANAPRYFAKLMDKVLGTARKRGIAFNFFDDICIYAASWDELMGNLEIILKSLSDAKLTLQLSKCKFGLRKVEYLGYVLGEGSIRPGERKITAIEHFPTPKDKHDLRRFIGLASFFRRFVPGFATLCRPMSMILKKNLKFSWGEDQEKSFLEIKGKLISKPVLKLYNPRAKRTELHTDASSVGLGAMLMQSDVEQEPLSLVYAISRSTTDVEAKYHSSRLELMAIAWALTRLRPFLIGLKFTIVTDCQSLVYLNAWKTKNAQIARWMSEISEYDLEVKHRPGERMQHVDALSRAPINETLFENSSECIMSIQTTDDEVLIFQRSDPYIKEIITILQKNVSDCNKLEKQQVNDFVLRDGILFKKIIRDNRIRELYVVPNIMRKYLVIKYHDLSSHFGVDKTAKRIEEYYYFPRLRRYVKMHIRNCLECILAKRKSGPGDGELHPIPPGRRPFEIVHVDHVGPFPTTERKNVYVFALIDNLTRFVYIVPVKNVTSLITINKLKDFIHLYGAPGRIISDRGTCFTSHIFQEFCLKYGIKHTLNSSRHPQANGLVERLNQTLLPAMKISGFKHDKNNWDRELSQIGRDINCTVSSATGKTPFEALLGYLPRFADGNLRILTENCETYTPPIDVQKDIRNCIKQTQERYKERYDKYRHKNVKFKVGDIVFMKRNPIFTGESKKLQPSFSEPMVVIEILSSDTYRVKKLNESNDRGYETTAHVCQLKVWTGFNDDSDSDVNITNNSKDYEDVETSDNISINSNISKVVDVDDITDNGTELKENTTCKTNVNARPKRVKRKPSYLQDYV